MTYLLKTSYDELTMQNQSSDDTSQNDSVNKSVGSSFVPDSSTSLNDSDTKPAATEPNDQVDTLASTPVTEGSQPLPDLGFTSDDSVTQEDGNTSKKAIATILGVVLLVAGVAAGVLLVNRNSEVRIKAWDCVNYVFEVSEDGVVSVRNGSTRNEPLQKADVKINGSVVATLDVPALNAGDAATLGTVPVPDGGFSWEVIGTKDCEDSGSYGEQTATPTTSDSRASCNAVVAYDENWNQLSATELSQLQSGDIVRFTVSGNTTSGTFQKAQFTVNGTERSEVTAQRPGSSDFYDEYTIPSGVIDIRVTARIYHSTLGWL